MSGNKEKSAASVQRGLPALHRKRRSSGAGAGDAVVGEPYGGRDVYDRNLAEAALREIENRYHDLFVNAPIGIFQRGLDGSFTNFNTVLIEQFQCRTPEELVENYSDVASRWAEPGKLQEFNRLLLKNRTVRGFAVKTRLRDGTIKWFSLYASMDSSDAFFNGFSVDITEQKRAEEELNHYREHLENLVRERTTDLARAVAAADAANRAKSEFLANMNHEMRTPLNAIVGMTTMLLDADLNDVHRRSVETISYSSDILLLLITTLLDISKIEDGGFELESSCFDLADTVSKIIDMFTYSAVQKGLKLEVQIDSDVPLKLKGDSGRISQILINLIGNAIKFTDEGRVAFHIKRDTESGQKTTLRFIVKDSGIGIPLDKQEMIFRPFTQVDGSVTRKYGGTGLGLSISKTLVQLMGGEVGVESSEGDGSTFWFTAVLEKQTPETRGELPVTVEPGSSGTAVRTHQRLLLVEDDPINQQVASSYLKKLGYFFDIAENGREALQALSEKEYDLVLIDIMMPEIGGVEATAIIRDPESNVRNHGIPVVALTAKATMGDRETCLSAGMNDFLTKPLRIDVLKSVLSKWLPDDIQRPLTHLSCLLTQFTDDQEVISLFVAKAPEYVAALQERLRAGDAGAVTQLAHKLTGAASAIGAREVAVRAAEIEVLAANHEMTKTEQKVQELAASFENLLALLKRHINRNE